ncbi:hypothetical protein IGI37_001005 [Enterococcus sp. AZ194]
MLKSSMKLEARERSRIIESYLSHEISLSEAAREGSASTTTINRWLTIYENDGPTGLLPTHKNNQYSVQLKLSANK